MEQSTIPKRYLELSSKWKNRSINPQEAEEFARWYNSGQDLPVTLPPAFASSEKELEKRMLENILYTTKASKKIKLWPKITAIAASILFVLGIATWMIIDPKYNLSATKPDLPPGKQGATLTLANGKKIHIRSAAPGNVTTEEGVTITKTADGQLRYTLDGKNGKSTTALHMLETGRGEQIQIALPDGSLVYLNAASRLKFPASFVGQAERKVELSGEGYFQVKKDRQHPFLVKTKLQELKVLGTSFNISCYSDETTVLTTLVEGSIQLTAEDSQAIILKPDQQVRNDGGGLRVSTIDAQSATDWKQGFFVFNQQKLEQVLKRVSRWYDVEVDYEDPKLKSVVISGTISKYEHLSSLIEVLEKGGIASFELKKHTLSVKYKD